MRDTALRDRCERAYSRRRRTPHARALRASRSAPSRGRQTFHADGSANRRFGTCMFRTFPRARREWRPCCRRRPACGSCATRRIRIARSLNQAQKRRGGTLGRRCEVRKRPLRSNVTGTLREIHMGNGTTLWQWRRCRWRYTPVPAVDCTPSSHCRLRYHAVDCYRITLTSSSARGTRHFVSAETERASWNRRVAPNQPAQQPWTRGCPKLKRDRPLLPFLQPDPVADTSRQLLQQTGGAWTWQSSRLSATFSR